MDALSLLTADHNRVRGLFALFTAAHDQGNLEEARGIVQRIANELTVHTSIEESTFYPAIRDMNDELAEMVAEALEEHGVAKNLLQEIEAVGDGEAWVAKAQVLVESVEHHAEEEEREMFPKVRSACDTARLEELGVALEDAKKQLGAPTLQDKIDLTDETLRELAREQQIPGRSKMDHEELAATVAPD